MAILNIKDLPDDLYERLKQRAARRRRSVAQEVTHILERVVQASEPLSLLDLEGLGAEAWADVDATAHVAAERDAWDRRE